MKVRHIFHFASQCPCGVILLGYQKLVLRFTFHHTSSYSQQIMKNLCDWVACRQKISYLFNIIMVQPRLSGSQSSSSLQSIKVRQCHSTHWVTYKGCSWHGSSSGIQIVWWHHPWWPKGHWFDLQAERTFFIIFLCHNVYIIAWLFYVSQMTNNSAKWKRNFCMLMRADAPMKPS